MRQVVSLSVSLGLPRPIVTAAAGVVLESRRAQETRHAYQLPLPPSLARAFCGLAAVRCGVGASRRRCALETEPMRRRARPGSLETCPGHASMSPPPRPGPPPHLPPPTPALPSRSIPSLAASDPSLADRYTTLNFSAALCRRPSVQCLSRGDVTASPPPYPSRRQPDEIMHDRPTAR